MNNLSYLVDLIYQYNSTGFGEAHVYLVRDSKNIISGVYIHLYNAGWSENEELDDLFMASPELMCIINHHPIHVFLLRPFYFVNSELITCDLSIFEVVAEQVLDVDWRLVITRVCLCGVQTTNSSKLCDRCAVLEDL